MEHCESCAALRDRIQELEFEAAAVRIGDLKEDPPKHRWRLQLVVSLLEYFKRWLGSSRRSPENPVTLQLALVSLLGSFLAIALLGLLQAHTLVTLQVHSLIGSMGAAAVLLYAAPSADLAQPRNVIFGNTIGAIVGCSLNRAIPSPELSWLTGALAVSLAITCMHLSKTLHPPGGATALIAAVTFADFWFVLATFLGYCLMVAVALIVDNTMRTVSYPKYWI